MNHYVQNDSFACKTPIKERPHTFETTRPLFVDNEWFSVALSSSHYACAFMLSAGMHFFDVGGASCRTHWQTDRLAEDIWTWEWSFEWASGVISSQIIVTGTLYTANRSLVSRFARQKTTLRTLCTRTNRSFNFLYKRTCTTMKKWKTDNDKSTM